LVSGGNYAVESILKLVAVRFVPLAEAFRFNGTEVAIKKLQSCVLLMPIDNPLGGMSC
jgi:hypothetical protein